MVSSVDGRTLIRRWRPENAHRRGLFDQLHDRLGGDAWLAGRVTGQEYAKVNAYPDCADQPIDGNPGSPGATRPLTVSCSTPMRRSPADAAISATIRSSSC